MGGMDTQPIFKCGAIVAPVTDWKYYSTIYSERYLRTPDENPEGYEKSKSMQNDAIENYKKHDKIWIIHGTADDNVHFINSAALSKFLIKNDVYNVELAYFAADENHSFALRPDSVGYNRHYKLMTRLVEECLEPEKIERDVETG